MNVLQSAVLFGALALCSASCGNPNSFSGGNGSPVSFSQTSPQAHATARRDFLENSPMQEVGVRTYNLGRLDSIDLNQHGRNPLRNPRNQNVPNAPVIHLYHFPLYPGLDTAFPLVVSFPPEFRFNLPISIQEVLRARRIDHLDLFFVAQLGMEGFSLPHPNPPWDQPDDIRAAMRAESCVKPAFWADPLMPHIDQIQGFRWQHNISLTVFEPNVNIEVRPETPLTIRTGHLKPFWTTPHHGRISNDVGKLNLVSNNRNYAFWSLAISPTLEPINARRLRTHENRIKAAATLHLLMNQTTYQRFVRGLDEGQSLQAFLNQFEIEQNIQDQLNRFMRAE